MAFFLFINRGILLLQNVATLSKGVCLKVRMAYFTTKVKSAPVLAPKGGSIKKAIKNQS